MFLRERAMASSLYLTLFVGPVVAIPAPKPVIDALLSAEVTVAATGRSGFRLDFTIADRSPLQTLFLLASGSPLPVLRVILMATVGGIPEVLMDGIIKHHEIVPSATQGNSTLKVMGEDISAVMDLIDLTGLPYPGMSPDLRVLTMLAKYGMFGMIPEVIPALTLDIPIPVDRIPTQHGTDLAYINELARDTGYCFYVDPGPLPGVSQAYWGPQVKIGVPQPSLNVNMDSWTNVESLSFRYQPEQAVLPLVFLQERFSKMVIPIPIPPVTPLNPPLAAIVPIPQRIEPLENTAKMSPAQALMVGMARASDSSDVVTGDGTLDVLRYGRVLKARQLVAVRGAGPAYDGLHYVHSTTHTIKRGQYKQSFTLKRNGLISSLPLVPTLPF
jgi:hypothetical protein